MANIPVERNDRGGIPWWAWLLGALLLLGLLLALTQCNNEDEIVDDELGVVDDPGFEDDAGVVDPVAPVNTAPILVLDELYLLNPTPADVDARVGRTVTLTDAPVFSLAGDSSFYVGTDDNRRVLVVLSGLGESESGAGPPEGADGRLNVDVGDRVSISGTVARFERNMRGTMGLPQADRERLLGNGLAVVVNSLADIRATEGQIRTNGAMDGTMTEDSMMMEGTPDNQ